MEYGVLNQKITNGEYDTKLPYPPYRPDKKEREANLCSDREMKKEWKKDESRLKEVFEVDLRKHIEYKVGYDTGNPNFQLTDEQFNAVFNMAWEDGLACGYHETFYCASNLVDLIGVFVKKEE